MVARYRLAGALSALGIFGLTLPLLGGAHSGEAKSAEHPISLAIVSGDQLQLSLRGTIVEGERQPAGTSNLVCSRIFRLGIANVGVACERESRKQRSAALLSE